jgi:putative transposase
LNAALRAPPVVERWCNGNATAVERQLAELIIDKWRKRLCDLSWLMKCLNEHLARRANAKVRTFAALNRSVTLLA